MPETTPLLAALLTALSHWAQPVTAWMLTYLLHSTLLLGGAWLLGRLLGERRLALQETAWKVALVGGVLTASLQLGLALEPWAGQVSLAAGGTSAVTAGSAEGAAIEASRAVPTPAGEVDADERTDGVVLVGFAASGAGMAVSNNAPPAAVQASPAEAGPRLWPLATAAAWLAVAGFGLVLLILGYARLHRCLAERRPVTEGALPALFGRLLERAGLNRPLLARAGRLGVPRLTASPRLPVPIAWGVARREVSLPEEVVEDLSPYHQESILAHEISHLRRHDPAWLAVGRVLETALFFQPLNRVARRRLQEIAEYRCDDGAVALTGRPVELARCLTEVASWRIPDASRMLVPGLWVPGMTTPAGSGGGRRAGSALAARVRRILAGGPRDAETLPRLALPAAAALLLCVALAAPGVTGQEPAPEPPPPSEVPEAPEVQEAPETPHAPEAPEAPEALEASEAPEVPEAPEALESPEAPEAPRPGDAPALPRVPRTAPAVLRVAPHASVPAVPRPAPLPAPDRVPMVRGTAPTPPTLPNAPAVPAVPAPDGTAAPLPPAGALPPVPRAEPLAAFRLARFEAAPSPGPSPSPAPRADSAGLEAEIDRLVSSTSEEERRAVAVRLEAELGALEARAAALTDRLGETGSDARDLLETRLDELEARYDRVGDLLQDGEPDRAELRPALTAAFAARDRVQHELERLTTGLADRHHRRSAEARREAEEHARRAMERAEREAERARREMEERHEASIHDLERAELEAERRAEEMKRAAEMRREAVERRSEEKELRREVMAHGAERRAAAMERRAAAEVENLHRADRQVALENARVAEENARIAALSAQLQGRRERMEAERTALRAELRRLTADGSGLAAEERRRAGEELRSQLTDLVEELADLDEELSELDEEVEEPEEPRRKAASGDLQD